ncbi:MAG: hypothetical protein OEY01_16505 [Desulfobulbaceae bacterium]|nr:hypothetical protein [Desulfobulbaceae bacterium]
MTLEYKLKKAREYLGKNQKEMASLVGSGYRSWQGYEQGQSVPGGKVFDSLSKLGFNINWFFGNEVPMLLAEQTTATPKSGTPTEAGGDFVHIPRYEVTASAGAGSVIHSEQVVDYLSFKTEWVRNSLGVSVRDLALISVIGDSMEPTLSEGDVVLIDMTTRSVLDGSIYVLQLNGGLLVKRIQRKLDGSIVVKSDNNRYDPEIVSEDKDDQLKIVGRVVWVGRRL